MSDSYIASLLTVTGAYEAQYTPTPISQKPVTGCDLPPLLTIPTPPADLTPPDASCCTPTFIPFPIIPAPFNLPENCPNGLTFVNTPVNIIAELGGSPVSSITVGASQNADFCSYSLDIPDVLIPCFPTGPQFTGSVGVTVVDPNSGSTTTDTISVDAGPNCQFALSGGIIIDFPVIPCYPNGPSLTVQPVVVKDPYTTSVNTSTSLSTAVTATSGCVITIDPPPINIPCYPNGISFSPIKFLTPYNWTDSGVNPSEITIQQVGSGATVQVTSVSNVGAITGVLVTSGGSHYSIGNPPTVKIIGNGSGAIMTANIGGGAITSINIINGGLAYTLGDVQVYVIPPQTPIISSAVGAGHQVLDLSNNGALRNTSSPCNWGGTTIVFPMPDCTGGFLTNGGITVKVNGSTISNTVGLTKASTTDANNNNVCNLNLGGEIDLTIPTAICPSGVGVSSSNTITFTDVSGSTFATTDLSYSSCQFGFSGNVTIPDLLHCPSYAAPTTSITFATGPTSSSSLTFGGSPNLCNLNLSGTIYIPTGGGIVPYIGAGPPSATTLSNSYTYNSTQPPSLYIDTSGLGLYVCTTGGTYNVGGSGGSVWAQIGGSGGGGGVWI